MHRMTQFVRTGLSSSCAVRQPSDRMEFLFCWTPTTNAGHGSAGRPKNNSGLSCFNAANAALRRGITTSENTKSVILTAADWPGKTDTIEELSVHRATMVVFTMRTEFRKFIEKLSVDYPPQTPVAIVKHAGYAEKEEVVRASLGTILDRIGQEKLPFEYLIYVGEFLTHRDKEPQTGQADH